MSGEQETTRGVATPLHQHPFPWLQLAAAIRSNVDRIATAEQAATGQSLAATHHQCSQAVRFIAYYADDHSRFHWRAPAATTGQVVTVDATRHRSVFEVFTAIAVHLQVGHRVRVRIDASRKYLKDTAILGDCTDFQLVVVDTRTEATAVACNPGATQIIFDSGDVEAAFIELASAGADRTAPWRIRRCWVQESLRSRFESAFPPSATEESPLGVAARTLGGRLHNVAILANATESLPLIVGVSPAQWSHGEPVVLVQYFRTVKEVLGHVGASASAHLATSVSVWTENMSLALEVAAQLTVTRNVWMNCVGLLNPKVAFTFADAAQPGTFRLYGTELAQCQAAIFDASAAEPSDDVQRRLAVAFRKELADEDDDFASVRMFDNITYMTSTRRRSANRRVGEFVIDGADTNDALWRRRVAAVVYGQFQTIVIPFGSVFAN